MKIRGGKFGQRTGATLRKNKFDSKICREPGVVIQNENDPVLSLNKHKRWEILDTSSYRIMKQRDTTTIENNYEIKGYTHKSAKYGFSHHPGGLPLIVNKNGRNGYQYHNTNTNTTSNDIVVMPFKYYEYPINRELHNTYDTICRGCLRSEGRCWQLRGLGDKSLIKTKGMRRELSRARDDTILV